MVNLRSVLILLAVAIPLAFPLRYAHAEGVGSRRSPVSNSLWYSIYASDRRVGTEHSWSQPAIYNGQSVTEQFSDTTMSLVAFGSAIDQKVSGRVWVDPVSNAPIYETFTMESGGASTAVTATYFPDHIDAMLTSGASTTHKTVAIPPGVTVCSSDIDQGVSSASATRKGQVVTEAMFDPVTLQLNTYTITVQDVDQALNDPFLGHVKNLTLFSLTGPDGDMTVYQDSKGTPLVISMAAGLVMRRDQVAGGAPADTADATAPTDPNYVPPPDFAVATAVVQSGVAIDEPRSCKYLKVELTTPGDAPRTLEVRAVDDRGSSASVSDAASESDLTPYLADAFYLSLDDPQIVKQASALRGSSTSLSDLVARTHDWVYRTMRPAGSLGLPRSAASILQDPRGVCRDYAILYTALARAEGVPTRICAGLVAFDDKFYYHAWAESYVGGKTGWLPVDPTMNTRTVDATHIPLSRGNPEAIFDVASQIGRISARIIDASN